jgi:ABC-type transport system involved in cytochrome c biogenesis permease component
MTFLPIVERELRVACRRRESYWLRVGVALLALLLGAWMLLWTHFASQQRLGLGMFVALSIVAFLYSLLAGLRTTADCLSEEKREGTLGLLFLTDLKGYDIVLGKLAATSLNVFYGLLAIFPIMAVPLLLGGVTWTEFWRVALVALNTLFFSLTIGLFASAVSRSEWAGI